MRGIKLGEVGIWDPLNMSERDRRHVVYNGLRCFALFSPQHAAVCRNSHSIVTSKMYSSVVKFGQMCMHSAAT